MGRGFGKMIERKINTGNMQFSNKHLRKSGNVIYFRCVSIFRGGCRAAATSKMEHLAIIVKGFQSLTIPKCSILNVVAALDPPLHIYSSYHLVGSEAATIGVL